MKTEWSQPSVLSPIERSGGDPLGIRAWANRVARRLVPGLTQSTSRTRGFALLCLAVEESRKHSGHGEEAAREAFLRTERLWVGAQISDPARGEPIAGTRRAKQLITEDGYPLNRSILADQLASGVWGTYRRAAVSFGLLDGRGRSRIAMDAVRLASRGRELASAIRADALPSIHVKRLVDPHRSDVVTPEALSKVHATNEPSQQELEILADGMRAFDASWDQALGRLHQIFHRTGSVKVSDLMDNIELLNRRQATAARAAQEVLWLVGEIEEPFRRWVSDPATRLRMNPATLAKAPAWEIAEREGENDMVRLQRVLEGATPSSAGDMLMQFHRELSTERGGTPWEEGDEGRSSVGTPTFALGALERLFREGVCDGR